MYALVKALKYHKLADDVGVLHSNTDMIMLVYIFALRLISGKIIVCTTPTRIIDGLGLIRLFF